MKTALLLVLSMAALLNVVAADDIISTPAKQKEESYSERYPTSTAFLAATKNGEIPEMLHGLSKREIQMVFGTGGANDKLGYAVANILSKEYGCVFDAGEWHNIPDPGIACGKLLSLMTSYELNGHDKNTADDLNSYFHNYCSKLGHGNQNFAKSFQQFATNYRQAIGQYLPLKQQNEVDKKRQEAALKKQTEENEDRYQAAIKEKKRQEDAVDKQAEEERRQKKAIADAQVASQNAADEIKQSAAKEAMEAAAQARKQKLGEILQSNAYKLWRASLKVEQGEDMMRKAQAALDHDDAVTNESGVSDLTARRAAGEMLVAAKELVKGAFADYQQLGGTAKTPADVVAGPDPAAQYR